MGKSQGRQWLACWHHISSVTLHRFISMTEFLSLRHITLYLAPYRKCWLLCKHQRIKIGSAYSSQNSGLPADKLPYMLYRQQILGIWNFQNNRVLLAQQQVMKSDRLLQRVDTSAITVLFLVAILLVFFFYYFIFGCLHSRNEIQLAMLQYAHCFIFEL